MNGRHRAALCVEKQYRNAVRRADADPECNLCGREPIALTSAIGQPMGVANIGGMDLPQAHIRARIPQTRTETVALPDKFLKGVAAIDAVFAQPE
jgi:hypothetical protein